MMKTFMVTIEENKESEKEKNETDAVVDDNLAQQDNSVTPLSKYSISFEQASKDAQMALLYDAVKSEYEHCVKRSEKLDNKVYILFTVCAFLIVILGNVVNKISDIAFPENRMELFLIIVFAISLTACIGAFTVILIILAGLIKPIMLKRFKSSLVYDLDMISFESKTAFRTILQYYEDSISVNDSTLEDGYKKFGRCVRLMIFVIIDMIVLFLLCQFM